MYTLVFVFLILSPSCFAQTATDSLTRNDSINRSSISRRLGASDSSIIVEPIKPVESVPVQKKHKTNQFVWNDRKFKSDSSHAGIKIKRHSPLYAALFSLAVPGLGQAYNRKYWKIPIVYAGFGGLGYALYYTATNFVGYRNAYRLQVDEDPLTWGEYKGVSDGATLKSYRDYYKKNLDISGICTGVWYALVIIDATVDAHLFEWNMKDDIHLSWQPSFAPPSDNYPQAAAGIQIRMNF